MGYLSVVMIKLFKDHPKIKKVLQLVLGALTTFSTFQFELVTLLYSHHIILALVYAFISYCFGVILSLDRYDIRRSYILIQALLIMIGGGLGAVVRAWLTDVTKSKWSTSIPIATLIVNWIGSFLIGLTTGLSIHLNWIHMFLLLDF